MQEVLQLSNLDPTHYRIAPLVRRITACLRVLRAATIEKARLILADHPKRVPLALNALLIGTTCFFRDSLVFSHIENRLVPDLLRRHRHPRVWSAACSDGAELYSVAMLFAEHGPLAKGQFYGSDCRPYAIEIAKAGRYGKSALTHVALDYARRHFTQGADFVDVNDALKAATSWGVSDIFASESAEPWDLILCRNLAIYLDPGPARQLWARLADSLSSGGALVVGKAEKITLPELYRDGPCLYRKH